MRGINAVRRRLCLLLLVCGMALNAQSQAQLVAAPVLTFKTLSGQTIRLSDLRGKIVLINFWATSCSICLAEMPDLIQTYRQFQPHGLEVIAVAMSYDQPDLIEQYIALHGLPFPVVWDGQGDREGDIGRSFGNVEATPTTFIVDRHGLLISRTVGIIDFERLRRYLEEALK